MPSRAYTKLESANMHNNPLTMQHRVMLMPLPFCTQVELVRAQVGFLGSPLHAGV